MNYQERYDELDHIVNSIDILVEDINDKYYIEMLKELKFEAQNELEEVKEQLQKKYDEEGNIFELIAEECDYDDEWREENGID